MGQHCITTRRLTLKECRAMQAEQQNKRVDEQWRAAVRQDAIVSFCFFILVVIIATLS